MAKLADLKAWIDRDGVALNDSLEPQSDTAARRLDALVDRTVDARVIVLGELDHWIAEKNDFRLWWLKRLHQRFRLIVAEELGFSDGQRVQQYLRAGDASWLDRVPTFGYRGDERSDRVDTPTGVLKASFDRYPTARFKASQCSFYRRMRELGLVDFHGIDINGVAGAGYTDAERKLASVSPLVCERLRARLARRAGETALEEADRLRDVQREFENEHSLREVLVDIKVMEGTFRYQLLAHPAPDYAALSPALAVREEMMKRAVDRLLDATPSDAKLVLMGHALHLAKNDARVGGALASGPGGNRVSSLGHYLAQELRERVFSVWFVFGFGEDCQPFPDLANKLAYPSRSLNAAMLGDRGGRRQSPLVLSIDNAPEGSAEVGHLYGLTQEIDLRAQMDAVFFVPQVTPLPEM